TPARAALLSLAGAAAATGCADKPAVVLPPARLLDRGAGQSVDLEAHETPVTVRVEDERGATVAGAQFFVGAGGSSGMDMPFGGHGSVGEDGIADGPSDSAGLFVARPRL